MAADVQVAVLAPARNPAQVHVPADALYHALATVKVVVKGVLVVVPAHAMGHALARVVLLAKDIAQTFVNN